MMEGRWSTERGFAGRGLFVAAALLGSTALVGTLAVSPASAQSNEELMKRIEKLEKSNNASRGRHGTSLEISGHINKMFLITADKDNRNRSVGVPDNGNSPSRFRMVGSASVDEAVKTGFYLEYAADSGPGNTQSDRADANANPSVRHATVWIEHKDMGRIWIGQTSDAADGASEYSLGGTGAAFLFGSNPIVATGQRFTNEVTGTQAGGPTVGSAFTGNDGTRQDLIRYDTPKFAGAQLRVAYGDNDNLTVGLHYTGGFGSIKATGAVAYQNGGADGAFVNGEVVNGSVSFAHDSGFNVSFMGSTNFNKSFTASTAAQSVTNSKSDNSSWSTAGQIGYTGDFLSWGSTAITFTASLAGSQRRDNDSFEGYAANVVQNIDNSGTELYAGLGLAMYDSPGATIAAVDEQYNSMWQIWMGMRQKF